MPTLFLLKNKKKPDLIGLFRVVRVTGLEPAHRLTLEPNGDDTLMNLCQIWHISDIIIPVLLKLKVI